MRSRDIYACLVRWHPSRFRASFADEMLATFEDASLEQSSGSLIADAIVSELVRKRVGLHIWAGIHGEDPVKLLSLYIAISWVGTCALWHPANALHRTFLCGAAIVAFGFSARRYNRIAAKALQQEIEAIDDCIRAC